MIHSVDRKEEIWVYYGKGVLPMKIGCVLMAAGFGRRFGGNKLTAELGCGETLIDRALSTIPADKLDRVVVVTQYPQVAAPAEKYGFTSLHNPHPERGQSESIRIGLAALEGCDAVLFLVADQPKLQKETVSRLLDFAAAHPDRIVGLGHNGRRGNPCLFPARFFPELMALTGDCGGRSVILAHEDDLLLLEVPSSQLIDIDTPEQLGKL